MSPTEPIVIRGTEEMRRWSEQARAAGRRVALVPTMGALHEGHLSLVRIAAQRADRVVVSIFVNPTQFGPNEDFARYPRDLGADLEALRKVACDAVFAPDVEAMYPMGDATRVRVERLGSVLCGRDRPDHFEGVTTIVTRLFNATRPNVAVFGEKDFQQLQIIRRITRDLLFDVEIVGGPIVREPDGVAMSSRNRYLGSHARTQARALNAALRDVHHAVVAGERDARQLVQLARERIRKEPLATIDYIEVVDEETLQPVDRLARTAVMAMAVRFEGARLLDNCRLEIS